MKAGKLLHGSIDRLVIRRKNNKVVALEIIDYKTGGTDASVYVPQMNAYKRAMELLYRLDAASIKTSLLFTETDLIVTV